MSECSPPGHSIEFLRPDSKSQVTIEYDGAKPRARADADRAVDAARAFSDPGAHPGGADRDGDQTNHPGGLPRRPDEDLREPHGYFVVGGPQGDAGITGRKIIVDTYGGMARHGGGAFSGKDPTKVDRSAAYMARHIAKNLVAAGFADQLEVQLAYAIGVPEPVSVMVDTFDTGKVPEERLSKMVTDHFDLTPRGIIKYLDLRRPIFRPTAAFGHFGRSEESFTWESTQVAAKLASEAKV